MDYPLKDTLPYYFLQSSALLSEVFSADLSQHDITIPMYRVLVVLDGGETRMLNQIASALSIEQSTLSRQITVMVKQGLVSRTRPDENGRIVQITITKLGQDIVSKMIPVAQNLEAITIGNIPKAEIDALKLTMEKILDNIRSIATPTA